MYIFFECGRDHSVSADKGKCLWLKSASRWVLAINVATNDSSQAAEFTAKLEALEAYIGVRVG